MLESKRKATIFITISLALALVAGFLFFKQVQTLNSNLGGMTEVYVASKDISSRTLIQSSDLEKMEIPNKFLTNSQVTDIGELENKVLVVPISKGDFITKNIVKPVSNVQNEDNRLISLYSSERVRFDQEVQALDRVDIIVSQTIDGKPKTEVFMQDVLVSMVAESEGKFAGVGLEIPKADAPKLIHMENYADQIRVLKANVGKNEVAEKK